MILYMKMSTEMSFDGLTNDRWESNPHDRSFLGFSPN